MEERNMLCAHQIFGVEIEQGDSHLYPNPCTVLGGTVGLLNPGSHPVMSASGNPANFVLPQIASYHGNSAFHGNAYIHRHQQQPQPPASGHDMDSLGQSNFNSSYMVSSSSSGLLPPTMTSGTDQLPSSSMIEASTHDYGRNHHFMDDARSCKRRNVGAVSVDCNYVNHIPNFNSSPLDLSLNYGIQDWNVPYGPVKMMDATHFNTPEYRGLYLPLGEGSQGSLRSRPNVVSLQMVSPLWHCPFHNFFFQGNFVSPTIQPQGVTWVGQFGSNVGAAVYLMSNCPAIPSFQGTSMGAGSLEIRSMCGHQESFRINPVIVFHPPCLHHQHHYLQPVQAMQIHNYCHHPQAPAPSYGPPVNNLLHHGVTNTSREGVDSMSSASRSFLYSTDEESCALSQASTDSHDEYMSILSDEQDTAVLEYPDFHGVENFIDRHSDMRMDVDSMSYEELLVLEEQIGEVKTGLTEESIIKNLKTRVYSTSASLSSSPSDAASESGTCIICQVEYEENERIGTLDCGHDYHADCLKKWLLVKNCCPICKTSALAMDETGQ